jgi:hypothetical protein
LILEGSKGGCLKVQKSSYPKKHRSWKQRSISNPNSPLCFHIIFNLNIFSTLNCCFKRETLHDEKLIVQYFNN